MIINSKSKHYNDNPKISFKLDSSFRCESKTQQFPFVVAEEMKKVKEEDPSRRFLIFHDIEHFLNLKNKYPYCHEVIRCPEEHDDLCKGRLIFDFDLETPLECASNGNFVPDNFKLIIETLINHVFTVYYIDVDVVKLKFVWQITRYNNKFSMHLIVNNAYFSEYWVKQMRLFYELMRKAAEEFKVSEIMKTVDVAIARRNCTFRMIGCSKIGKLELELDSPEEATIYDCLVGIYHHQHLRHEQTITMSEINYNKISEKVDESKEDMKFRKMIKKNISINEIVEVNLDITDEYINKSVDIFDSWGSDGCFVIRDNMKDIINLDRVRAGECPVSGCIHDRENAYLKLRQDGNLVFYCRRGCKKDNRYGVVLGKYKTKKRKEGIIPLNTMKLKEVVDTKTTIAEYIPEIINKPRRKDFNFGCNTAAKRMTLGIEVVQIPYYLRT